MKYGSLDISTLHIRTYTDASFATNDSHFLQLGYVIFLCDGGDRYHILDFSSMKCKLVVRSIMRGETYASVYGFDCVYAIEHTLKKRYGQIIPITMLTYSKQIFNDFTRASHPLE